MQSLTNHASFGTLNAELLDVELSDELQKARNYLINLATSPDFVAKMQVAFGNSFDLQKVEELAASWGKGDFGSFPQIEMRDAAEINGARGAFAAATNTIYLSREFVRENEGNESAIASVLLEEYGHYIDLQINAIDSAGDEGEIFANIAQCKVLSESELAALKGEDDSAIVVLDGEMVRIEQANDRILQDNLNFFAGQIKNFGGLGNELKADLFKPIEINSPGEVIDNSALKFFKELKSTFKGSVFISPGSLGEIKFEYPLDIGVKLPDALSSDELFPLQPGINSSVTGNSFQGSKGFESPNAGIKFEFQPTAAKLTDIEVKNPLGEPFKLDGVNIGDPIKLEIGYDVAQFVKDIGKVTLPGDVGEISVSLPKIEEIKSANPSEPGGKLPNIAGSGRTQTGEGILNLTVDVDKALSFAFPALRILGNTIEFPNAQKEEAAAQKAKEDLQIQLDVLRTIPEQGQQLAFQEAERLRQESEIARDAAEKAQDKANKTRFKAKLSYDLLDLKANMGIGLQQDITFKPDDVKVTVSVDKGFVDAGKEITKSFGESFEIKAPSEGSGVMTVKAKYELSGQVENNLGFILQGAADIKALQFEASASAKNFQLANFKVGPFLSLQAPPGGFASKPLPFIGTDPNSKSANPFYVQIAPKRLSELTDGTEQDDRNPQPESTKNLIIEKEYKIPFNLPISVSDVTANEKDGFAEFTVTRRQVSNEQLVISYNTIGSTATASEDYQISGNTVTIAEGQNSATIRVPIINDTKPESSEQFRLILKNADGKEFAEGVSEIDAIGTIIDDDEKPDQPKDGGKTYNDPRIVTLDKQYHDFQAVGEFVLVESTSGDLKVQVRQEALGSDRLGSVSENTAVATVLAGQRIGIYRDRGLLINGNPTTIANNDSIIIGDGRIYREGGQYTIVYGTGDQLVANVSNRVNVSFFAKEERQGQIKGLLGNFNRDPKDDLTKRDGTVLTPPVTLSQLYNEYADSWRINQAESLFDYQPGQDTNTFTNRNFPRKKVTLRDLDPADIRRAELAIGDRISNPIVREATIIDYILTGFDESIIEEAIASLNPESVLAIVTPTQAVDDFAATTVNTPIRIDVTSNDDRTIGVPIAIANFDQTSTAGSIIRLDDNNTPDDKTDDQLIYTPTANFTGNDTFNYTVNDGNQTSTAKVTVNIANRPN